ncbi:hypothetical protein [Asaia sp. BMEF1]|uniref:hypothetical protein n=1 Tax=Asaia sp. BMEF1 TaxID=3155932 RepID=UPI003F6656D0
MIDAVTTGGMSRHAAARRFGISIASAIRWVRLFERSGSRTDRGTGGHQPSSVRRHRERLLALVEKEFSLTLRAMCERLQKERGVKADRSILSRFFRAEGITIKKNRARQQAKPAGRGAKTNMVRTCGWGRRGHRVRDTTPHKHWKTLGLATVLCRYVILLGGFGLESEWADAAEI